MKTPIIFLTLLFLFFSNNSFTQHYAPLQVGNTWVFLEDGHRIERCTVVADSVLVDSLLYYELLIKVWVPPLEITRYVRMEGDFYRLKLWGPGLEEFEEIYYKKNAHVGDIWYQEYDTVSYNEVMDSLVMSVFGQDVTMKHLQVNSMGLLVQYNEYWTEEFGKHLEVDFWGFTIMQLYGCVIDGTVYGDTSFYPTQVELENPTNADYRLHQNYPNPFNPTTRIDYSIPNEGLVNLRVYDILGNEVATLVNERKQPGNYSTTFDAANLPSGIYIYRIVSGNFQATKKMILLK